MLRETKVLSPMRYIESDAVYSTYLLYVTSGPQLLRLPQPSKSDGQERQVWDGQSAQRSGAFVYVHWSGARIRYRAHRKGGTTEEMGGIAGRIMPTI